MRDTAAHLISKGIIMEPFIQRSAHGSRRTPDGPARTPPTSTPDRESRTRDSPPTITQRGGFRSFAQRFLLEKRLGLPCFGSPGSWRPSVDELATALTERSVLQASLLLAFDPVQQKLADEEVAAIMARDRKADVISHQKTGQAHIPLTPGKPLRPYKMRHKEASKIRWQASPAPLSEFHIERMSLMFLSVSRNGLSLEQVPQEWRTKRMCMLAVCNHPFAIRFVPDALQDDQDIRRAAGLTASD